MPIDVAIWIRNKDEDNHRPGAIEGYCDNIHKEKIRVGINIGNCPGYGNSNGYTGWNSVSRLIIEEVPQSQELAAYSLKNNNASNYVLGIDLVSFYSTCCQGFVDTVRTRSLTGEGSLMFSKVTVIDFVQ